MHSTHLIKEAKKIVDEGKNRGMIVRLMGACAFRLHCPRFEHLTKELGRTLSDIDLATYGGFRSRVDELLKELGYTRREIWRMDESYRWRDLYEREGPGTRITVDAFFDKLEMCHTIKFDKRLEVDYPTIPLAELLVEKMQIVKLTEKDVKDTVILLREHEVGDKDQETINANYISKLLSEDWGFYYTVTTNLNKVRGLLSTYPVLNEEDITDINTKISALLNRIEKEPKSLKWKMREKLGIKISWYREV